MIGGPRRRLAIIAALIVLGVAALAEARPGGGDSYSGGGGHGGSGGGGDGGAALELLFHLIRLCIYYPAIGFPLLGIFVGFLIYQAYQKNKTKEWDSGPPIELKRAVALDDVRRVDPEFSAILFEDFAFRLYATCHEARHADQLLDGLAPYVSEDARRQLASREPRGPVSGVIVAAMRPWFVTLPTDPNDPNARILIGLELDTNYSVQTQQGLRTYYAIERWKLARSPQARTKKRDLANGFPCPNCGAPWQADHSHDVQRCPFCSEVVDNGRFDWQVTTIELVHSLEKPPTLTNDVPERGTDLATYRQDGVDQRWNQLLSDDPALSDQALLARLHVIYAELYAGWAKNDLTAARAYLSDGMHDYLRYWIDAYLRQALRNELVGMHITRTEIAKVNRDRWYDSVTIRLWGTGKDYVISEPMGMLVRGSKRNDRAYSEYWTLIRSAERRGPARADRTCGNCGAPASVGMTGACEHCGAHVTSGEFDWVLSKIEQDDSYRG